MIFRSPGVAKRGETSSMNTEYELQYLYSHNRYICIS